MAGTYLPWFLVARGREQVFLYYLLPTVPFMCLALGVVAQRLWHRRAGRALTVVFGTAALALFAVYYPLLTARPLSHDQWRDRLVSAECRADRPQLTTHGRPPNGWCWY